MEPWNQCIQQNNLFYYKKVKNLAFKAKSKGLLGKYNKTKGTRNVMAMCYSIPLRGDQINPNYCTN